MGSRRWPRCALNPDAVLMDIRMPRCNGLDATRLIKAEYPNIHIVMLTMSADDEDLFQAIRVGASGYLLKSQETAELYGALEEIMRGEVALARPRSASWSSSRILAAPRWIEARRQTRAPKNSRSARCRCSPSLPESCRIRKSGVSWA